MAKTMKSGSGLAHVAICKEKKRPSPNSCPYALASSQKCKASISRFVSNFCFDCLDLGVKDNRSSTFGTALFFGLAADAFVSSFFGSSCSFSFATRPIAHKRY